MPFVEEKVGRGDEEPNLQESFNEIQSAAKELKKKRKPKGEAAVTIQKHAR